MREKLIELLKNLPQVNHNEARVHGMDYVFGCAADHLIANGVTIQKWIPVSERLPESGECALVFNAKDDYFGLCEFSGVLWYDSSYSARYIDEITHWMPLPEPPKEDKC